MGGTALEKHTDKETLKQFNREIAISASIGAVQGALVGFTAGVFLRRSSVTFKNIRLPVKVFFYSSWIFLGAFYDTERQVKKFREKLFINEITKRERILDAAAERGIFLEGDLSLPDESSK